MPKFFVGRESIDGDRALITGDDAGHIVRVLRKSPGDEIILCDGEGRDYHCRVLSIDGGVLCEITGSFESSSEPDVDVGVFLAFTKGERLELAIQKCVELGAAALYPFPSARCVARYGPAELVKKAERWQRIADEASKQSMRARPPAVRPLSSFEDMLEGALKYSRRVILYEMEKDMPLREAIGGDFGSIALITGPEGGFEEKEIEAARKAAITPVTIGKRILRAETAPICALAAVMYQTGNLGG